MGLGILGFTCAVMGIILMIISVNRVDEVGLFIGTGLLILFVVILIIASIVALTTEKEFNVVAAVEYKSENDSYYDLYLERDGQYYHLKVDDYNGEKKITSTLNEVDD